MKTRKTSPKKKSSTGSVYSIDPHDWNTPSLKRLLTSFRGKKILVIGDVGVDRYTLGTVERISPEAPVPIVRVEEEKLKLGLAANVADNVKTLGGTVVLVGLIGKDRAALDFKSLLKERGISSEHLVEDPMRRTVLKERIVSERQQLLRVDYENTHSISEKTESFLEKKILTQIRLCDAVILEDYAKGMITRRLARKIFQECHRLDKMIAVDPNLKTQADLYQGASFLTPNLKEAEQLAGIVITDQKSLLSAGKKILERTRAQDLVITRGKDGIAVFHGKSGDVALIPTYAREVYDVSGAGDTVISVLSLGLSVGATLEESAVLANLAAGVEVGKRGTATVSPEEILLAMEFFERL